MPGNGPGRTGPNRRSFIKYLGATSALGATGLAGCTGGDGGGGDSTSIDSLSIGVTTSLSGPFAVFGQAELAGAELAKADLEDELGVDIELVEGDTEINPSTGLERMKRLVTKDGIDAAMGGVSSSVALKMGTWASENDVIYMATGAHSDLITGDQCAPYMFRPTCSNSMLANTIGQEMAEEADTWYLIYSDYTWGQTASKAVESILEEKGKEVVGKTAAPFPNDDYSQYLNEAKASDADGLGVLIAGLDLRKATSQLINKGMHEDFTLAMHQLEDIVYWGLDEQSASVLDVAGQVWGAGSPGGDEFKERVASNYDTDPYVRHFLGYLSMDQIVRSAVRADSTGAEEMRSALEGHEVTSSARDIKGGDGKMYWRECDHQLVQPTFSMKAKAPDEMQNEPYKQWFETVKTFDGDDVARSCDDTGCSL